MAEKKAIIIFSNAVAFDSDSKFGKKCATFAQADVNGLETLVASYGKSAASCDEAVKALEAGEACVYTKDGNIDVILENVDRRTLVVVVSDKGVAFWGHGVNNKAGAVNRAVNAQDIYVTVANITDLPITAECTGAVLYQMMKDPNLKISEINKLKEAISRMESVIARDNREPWDKHDCA
ncbi:MAG: hypothetical protein K2O76_06335 [Mailhella sp.]|nr:hypothetical protein [Mailhella sp.]